MVVTFKTYKNRETPLFNTEKVTATSGAAGSASSKTQSGLTFNGRLKNLICKSPNLTTDTTYTIRILDDNCGGGVAFLKSGIVDTQTAGSDIGNIVLTADEQVNLAGDNYSVKWSYATAQDPGVDAFETAFHLSN
ncbi:MAG: hypothetical protein V3U54_13010 [Thermodesulfobacteriota bacterium]